MSHFLDLKLLWDRIKKFRSNFYEKNLGCVYRDVKLSKPVSVKNESFMSVFFKIRTEERKNTFKIRISPAIRKLVINTLMNKKYHRATEKKQQRFRAGSVPKAYYRIMDWNGKKLIQFHLAFCEIFENIVTEELKTSFGGMWIRTTKLISIDSILRKFRISNFWCQDQITQIINRTLFSHC